MHEFIQRLGAQRQADGGRAQTGLQRCRIGQARAACGLRVEARQISRRAVIAADPAIGDECIELVRYALGALQNRFLIRADDHDQITDIGRPEFAP